MDELISRAALIEAINTKRRIRRLSTSDRHFVVSDVLACIYDAPVVKCAEEKPKRGRWIIHSNGVGLHMTHYAECSECHICGNPQWKVCPVCETKMETGCNDG